jgi:hypothetical protein
LGLFYVWKIIPAQCNKRQNNTKQTFKNWVIFLSKKKQELSNFLSYKIFSGQKLILNNL